VAFTVRTDSALEAALTDLAAREGTSRQEVVRRAVLERYEAALRHEQVDEAGRRLMARWGDVIERLGSA
jgi:predicted transcriptional regulator